VHHVDTFFVIIVKYETSATTTILGACLANFIVIHQTVAEIQRLFSCQNSATLN